MSRRAMPIVPSQRATIADFISPDNGYRGKVERLGGKNKDHIRDNVRELRALEAMKREQKEMSSHPTKELYKLPQFREVGSRLHEIPSYDENVHNGSSSPTQPVEYLPKGISQKRREDLALKRRQERYELEARMEELRAMDDKPPTPKKPQIPKAHVPMSLQRSNSDFIRKNKFDAIRKSPKQEFVEPTTEMKHEEFGRIPRYLEERKAKAEREEEERLRRMPDPSCPVGMKLMPEQERVETLQILERNKAEAMNQLTKLPFVVETPSMIRKKNDLEAKLKEIERAISLFCRPKVYVKL